MPTPTASYQFEKKRPQRLSLHNFFSLMWYTGALFAYIPSVMPAAHRATGYGIGYALNRAMGIVCAVIGASVELFSSVPIYICAALFGVLALCIVVLPLESQNEESGMKFLVQNCS